MTRPFYIYASDALTMRDWNAACVARVPNRSIAGRCVCDEDWTADTLLLAQLKEHPARVLSPARAELYIIPTPIYQSYACDGTGSRRQSYQHLSRVHAQRVSRRNQRSRS